MSSTFEARDLLAFAHDLADRSAAVILPHFRTAQRVDHKAGVEFDPVTDADRGAEAAIRAALAETYPGHGIIGEEFGISGADAEYCWVVDPIDGTRAFIMGQPLWGTLIGVLKSGRPVIGLMNQPFTGERFFASEAGSFYRRHGAEQRMSTRRVSTLSEALLASTTPDMFATGEFRAPFDRIVRAVRLRRFGGDCYNYCLVALGQLDLVVEAGLKPYDILPLIPIIEQAGGVVSTWEGGDPRAGGEIVAAGDPRLHEQAVNILSG